MKSREISKQLQRVNNLFKNVSEASSGNAELQTEWAKYLCVLVAGLLEIGLKDIYIDFASRKVTKPIANYVSSTITPIRTPKTKKFLEVAAAFNPTWKDELESYLNVDGRLEAIDSIMNQRHLIAHGQYQSSSITLTKLKDYLKKSIDVLEFIETQCGR